MYHLGRRVGLELLDCGGAKELLNKADIFFSTETRTQIVSIIFIRDIL